MPESAPLLIVLAAGEGRRFVGEGHKLDAVLDGRTVAERAVAAAVESRAGAVVVVTGAVEPHLSPSLAARVQLVSNPDWAAGQSTSLGVAVGLAEEAGADAIVVGLADQPFVPAEAWRRVAASAAPIAVATYAGRRGNPVRLRRDVWQSLPRSGDQGARALIRLHPELVERIPCPGSAADIDTREDLETWQNRSSTSSP